MKDCLQCQAGSISVKLTGSDDCVPCAKGTHVNLTSQQTLCDNCQVGLYQDERSGTLTCKKCPHGYINKDTGKDTCANCPSGQFQTLEGQTECHKCPSGWANIANDGTKCVQCEPGFYMEASGSMSSECKECGTGRYSKEKNAHQCISCPTGYRSKKKLQDQGNKVSCVACKLGEYQDAETMDACESCSKHGYGEPGDPMTLHVGAASANDCVCPKHTFQLHAAKDRQFFVEDANTASKDVSKTSSVQPQCATTLGRGRTTPICGKECLNIYALIERKLKEGLTVEDNDPQDCPASCSIQPNTQVADLKTMPGWWRANKNSLYFLDCKKDGTDRWMTDCPGGKCFGY